MFVAYIGTHVYLHFVLLKGQLILSPFSGHHLVVVVFFFFEDMQEMLVVNCCKWELNLDRMHGYKGPTNLATTPLA